MMLNDRVMQTIHKIRSDGGLTLETSAIASFTAFNTLINTQLIHQFVTQTDSDAFDVKIKSRIVCTSNRSLFHWKF